MHGNQPFFCGNTLVSPLGFCVYHVRSLFHCSRLHERTPNKHRVLAKIFVPARIREQINKNRRVRSCSFAKRLFVYANRRHWTLRAQGEQPASSRLRHIDPYPPPRNTQCAGHSSPFSSSRAPHRPWSSRWASPSGTLLPSPRPPTPSPRSASADG